MFWSLTNNSIFKADTRMPNIKYYANMYLFSCRKTPEDIRLDEHLQKTQHIGLTELCNQVIFHLKISRASENEIIVSTDTDKNDVLARFITYGNGEVQGSSILTRAIDWAGSMSYGG